MKDNGTIHVSNALEDQVLEFFSWWHGSLDQKDKLFCFVFALCSFPTRIEISPDEIQLLDT